MNNNYSNWSVKNAHRLEELLEEAGLTVNRSAPPIVRPTGSA